MNLKGLLSLTAIIFALFIAPLHADPVTPGVYVLGDHPDGALTATFGPYGLRFDDLPPPGQGPTFSFELNGAHMTLDWTGDLTTAVISGTLWNNSSGEMWSVVYTITGITTVAGGFEATAGSGTLFENSDFTGATHTLTSEQDGLGIAFRFIGDGHRLGGGDAPVGRGWLQPPGSTDDFLFTATRVPEPSALYLLAVGLIGLGFLRKTV